jgi:pilus assembly protein Flp/PilA
MKKILDFIRDELGATMPEYGLMAALIAAVCVLAITAVGGNVNALFEKMP